MTHAAPPEWAVRTEADRLALAAGYCWDDEAAKRVVRFAETYIAPKYTGGEFQLFAWQRRFLGALYGWRRPDGGRRFQKAVLHVPKKNGKTLLVSILAAYEMLAAGVPSALVASASTTKENAKQVYEQLATAFTRNPKLKSLVRLIEYQKRIAVPGKDAEYRALSADAPNAEGLNCSAVIVDEAHAHRSPKLYRTLEYAMIGRTDGLMVVISTAGDDLTHWYYSLVQRGRNLTAGTDTDPTLYAEVYEADPEADDLDDPATWRRVNPSLDQYPGFTVERFRLDMAAAKKNAADRLSFERYRLNIFRRPEDGGWIDLAKWDAAAKAVPMDDLRPYPCWLGFDASATVDPTSLSAVWLLPDQRFHVRSWAWVADAGVREREKTNLPKYRQFAAEGCMTVTPGDLIDKGAVRSHIMTLRAAGHQVRGVVMDINGAHVFGAELQGDGFEVSRMPQSFRFFNDPTRSFEQAVLGGRLTHDGGGWLRWCVNSVRLDSDSYGNCRPVRAKSVDKIDGAVSALMAFASANAASALPPPKPSVYEARGLEFWD